MKMKIYDVTQLSQGPKKESGTGDEKDETRRRLCDLGTWLGRVNELTDREKYMALGDPFVPPGHFKFTVRTEYGKKDAAKKVILTNLTELSIHKAWTFFCANTIPCLIMVQVAKVVSLKKDSPRGLKLATD